MNVQELKILLLEDNVFDVELIKYALRPLPVAFAVTHVATLEAFTHELTENAPDVVLSDFDLMTFTALDALVEFQASKLHIPFILVTGEQSEEIAVDCIKKGADDYLLKNTLKRLPSAIMNALRTKQAEREKKEAEKALRRSEELYRIITEHMLDLVSVLEPDGSYIYLSPSYKEILGYNPKELIGKNAFEMIHEDDRDIIEKNFISVNGEDSEVRKATFRVQHKDGTWVLFEALGRWIFDRQGNAQRIVMSSRDISDRQKAEKKLVENS
ncbi:MAG: PAS domain S-box protein [Bacteroidota bacterium]